MIYLKLIYLSFTGPYKWKVCLFQKNKLAKSDTLDYDLEIGKNNSYITFSGLHYGEFYNICVEALATNTPNDNCDMSGPNRKCSLVSSKCEPLPEAKKSPSQIFWSFEDDTFNPFTAIKIRMEEGTFDGEKSGLSTFNIR